MIIPYIPYKAHTRPLLVIWLLFFIGVAIGAIVIMERMPVEEMTYGRYFGILFLFLVFCAIVIYTYLIATYRKLIIDHEGIRERQLFQPERGIKWKDVHETHTRPECIAFREINKNNTFAITMDFNYKEKTQTIIESIPDRIRDHMDLPMLKKKIYKHSDEYKAIKFSNMCLALYIILSMGLSAIYVPLTIRLAVLLGEGADLMEYLPVIAYWGVLPFICTVVFFKVHRRLMGVVTESHRRWVRVGEGESTGVGVRDHP